MRNLLMLLVGCFHCRRWRRSRTFVILKIMIMQRLVSLGCRMTLCSPAAAWGA